MSLKEIIRDLKKYLDLNDNETLYVPICETQEGSAGEGILQF